MGGHYLDWANQPSVHKTYADAEQFRLPKDIQLPEKKLSSLLLKNRAGNDNPPALHMDDLSRILMLTYSHTAKARHAGGEFYYRSVASAGALYPSEIYVSTHCINGLHDGIYHFSVAHHSLSLLRRGNLFGHIAKASRPTTTKAPVLTFYLSAIFFRSAWKYRDRAYRYNLLDTGHLVENLILALKAVELPYVLSYDYDDHGVNRLLGLDETKEVCLSVCYISGAKSLPLEEETEVAELPAHIRNASHVAEKEVDYAIIREMHGAGGIVTSPSRHQVEMINELSLVPAEWTKINLPKTWPETINYPDCVFRRRSRRNYVREPISHDCLLSLLDSLCTSGLETASLPLDYRQSICTGFLIGNVEGFAPGFYLLEASARNVGIVAPGYFLDRMAHICLDQLWLANAAVQFLFLTNMDTLDRLWGARGYRYAMETAGRMGQRLYLAATSMRLGCCGIGAFYDMEATELLNMNNVSRLLYLVAVGPVKGK